MTAPCDPETSPEPREEQQEIILRLGDILPRVPGHLLKPGPHDTMSHVRFSVDELAEKISRGRVSVPLERLASVYPEVFRDSSAFPGEQDIQLPLQKLLEQVGLVAPKPPAVNGMPKEQLAQARAEASRIIEAANAPAAPTPVAAFPQEVEALGHRPAEVVVAPSPRAVETPAAEPAAPGPLAAEPPAPQPAGIARAISTAILGLFGRSNNSTLQDSKEEELADKKIPFTEKENKATTVMKGEEPGSPVAVKEAAQTTPKAAAAPIPPGCISLRVLPIFRLLPADILRPGTLPSEEARIPVPLTAIDSQLAGGHVEIPLEDFIKALPDDLRPAIKEAPGTQVWIPLDEIFQSLPSDHLFYMPPLGSIPEAPAAPVEEPVAAEVRPEKKAAPPDNPEESKQTEPAPINTIVPTAPPAKETTPAEEFSPTPTPEPKPTPQDAPPHDMPPDSVAALTPVPTASEITPAVEGARSEAVSEPTTAEISAASITPAEPGAPTPPSAPETTPLNESSPKPPPEPKLVPSDAAPEAVVETQAPASPVAEEAKTETVSAPPAPEVHTASGQEPQQPPPEHGSEAAAAVPSRAPWMRGFQVPPPRLFTASDAPAEAPAESGPVEPTPPPAPTPEAKRTADFLASQPGIFAAAAFVQGAVFASADFPRKPDLDALRDFMGSFVDHARESGRRLGWNRVLTIACEQFHATAVVRDTHFIVALHHDRVLASLAHDALIAAADDLSKAGG